MNKIKVAKELVKLAKSLVANDIDKQTKVRLDEAEKSGYHKIVTISPDSCLEDIQRANSEHE